LRTKVDQYRPQILAILGISAYRLAFNQPRAVLGRQPEPLGTTRLWVLPNPSGLNAHYTPTDLARVFGEFRHMIDAAAI
jgi:double-stranded uracil-DNA glycosylase